MNQRAVESMTVLENTCQSPRTKAILELAKERRIQDRTIRAADNSEHSIPEYAMQLLCYASIIGCFKEEDTESGLMIAMLLAMEISKDDFWSYGSKLMNDVSKRKIAVTRKEWEAVMAQYGTNATNPDKEYLLENNLMAAAFHCADLMTRILSLTGRSGIPASQMPEPVRKKLEACWEGGPVNTISHLAETFLPAYLGAEVFSRTVKPMLDGMIKNRSLEAPAMLNSDKSMKQSIAEHVTSVVWYYADVFKPQTETDIGKLFLAALCLDLRKTCDYQMCYGTRKKFCAEGRYSEPDRRKFNWEQYIQYEENNQIHLAQNKSLFMATRYLQGELPDAIASAIDSCSYNLDMNEFVEVQMMEEPLGLYLRVANIVASAYLAATK